MPTLLKRLILDYGKHKPHKAHTPQDFQLLSERLKAHHVNLRSRSLKKLWHYLHSPERPKGKTLDRLALFAGFQSWNDLRQALSGENDGELNFND